VHSENQLFVEKVKEKNYKNWESKDFFLFFRKGKCIFGIDPVSYGSEETRRHLTRCANPCSLSIQK
jgi:hypothetical protein